MRSRSRCRSWRTRTAVAATAIAASRASSQLSSVCANLPCRPDASTQALITLASQSSLTYGRLAVLFVVVFSATYLAAFVPLPNNIFAAQHPQYSFQQAPGTLVRRPASVPWEVLQQYNPHGPPPTRRLGRPNKMVVDLSKTRETAFYAAGGGHAGAHTWALLGEEKVEAPAVKTPAPVAAAQRFNIADLTNRLLRLFGIENAKALLTPPMAGKLPTPKSDVGKDLPHPSWGPSTQAASFEFGLSDDDEEEFISIDPASSTAVAEDDEVILVSQRNGQQVLRRLPLPFQKTDHSPPSRFIEHREPVAGSVSAKKHAIAHGLFPEDDEPVHAHEDSRPRFAPTASTPNVAPALATPVVAAPVANNGRMQVIRKPVIGKTIPTIHAPELKDDEASPEDHLAAQAAAKHAGVRTAASARTPLSPTGVPKNVEAPTVEKVKEDKDKITAEELSWGAFLYD